MLLACREPDCVLPQDSQHRDCPSRLHVPCSEGASRWYEGDGEGSSPAGARSGKAAVPDNSIAYDPSAYQFKAADPDAIRTRRAQKQQQGLTSTRGAAAMTEGALVRLCLRAAVAATCWVGVMPENSLCWQESVPREPAGSSARRQLQCPGGLCLAALQRGSNSVLLPAPQICRGQGCGGCSKQSSCHGSSRPPQA